VSGAAHAHNLTGFAGSYASDFSFQMLGLGAFAIPVFFWMLAWRWVRSSEIKAPLVKTAGSGMLLLSICTALALLPAWHPWHGAFWAGGMLGNVVAGSLIGTLNLTGAALLTAISFLVSIYLISTFSIATLLAWISGPVRVLRSILVNFDGWRAERRHIAVQRAQERAERRAVKRRADREAEEQAQQPIIQAQMPEPAREERPERDRREQEIPIHTLESEPAAPVPVAAPIVEQAAPVEEGMLRGRFPVSQEAAREPVQHPDYILPSSELLNEIPGKNPYDSLELKEIAGRIKAKFEEFSVHGNVVQINPGPVVTTFEFKPEAGIKYSRITTLSEDLCLGLQAESILIERIPGKPTIGIEVPNTRRELISLRQILESEEFGGSHSRLTICLGKDISGRIKVAALESMPHLLIAGSTGSGKSVMLNSLIMSILYKATPDEVRMILVDPKRLEMGLYEGVPHLLTPVITDAKKATNALRNAVLEMERRLKLLAGQGVRNIDQFNRKVRQLQNEPRSLFDEDDDLVTEELKPLPYILIVIDELADLMMVERGNVEESVTRLAQMARAVGMHLVLATQRPSVDVITGLIKANFPSRISFRVATRVDSRTVLDVMGAEHLLGKGDMLFLPPGSSRLVRVHGAFVTEAETNRVVEFWKSQARPDYDQTFLLAPPSDDAEDSEGGELDAVEDPAYTDAVRVVLEMGKASTSTLQRRLRLGYGRAARILDMMQREGIIGPPDGSKPREVLKRPDWLHEVESQLR